jgi:hypothetical protein
MAHQFVLPRGSVYCSNEKWCNFYGGLSLGKAPKTMMRSPD